LRRRLNRPVEFLDIFSPASIDDIVDPYLDRSGAQTPLKRGELAEAFHDRTEPTERRDLIFARILNRIAP
jgi:muramidase (phage lysozyme)